MAIDNAAGYFAAAGSRCHKVSTTIADMVISYTISKNAGGVSVTRRSLAQTDASNLALKYKRGFRKSPDKLHRITAALSDVVAGSSIRSAAKKHSLNECLLRRRLNGKVQDNARSGPAPVFSSREETAMAEWLNDIAERGMEVGPAQFLDFLQRIIQKEQKNTNFKNDRPSYTWYYSFLARNAHILEKNKEFCLKKSRSKTSPEQLDEWFERYKHFVSRQSENTRQSAIKRLADLKKMRGVTKIRKSTAQKKAVKVTSKYKKGFLKRPEKLQGFKAALSDIQAGNSIRSAAKKHCLSESLLRGRINGQSQLPEQTIRGTFKKGFSKNLEKLQRITAALSDIEAGSSIRSAAKKHSLNECLLRRRLHGKVSDNARSGRAPVFSSSEEEAMAEWLYEMTERGMGISSGKFLDFLQFVIRDEKKETSFLNDRPGYTWYYSFMARNAHILEKSKQSPLEHSMAKDSPEQLGQWFEKYSQFVFRQGESSQQSEIKLLGVPKKAEDIPRKRQMPAETKTFKMTFNAKIAFVKSPEKLQRIKAALADIEEGISIRSAAKKHFLNECLLRRRLNGEVQNDARSGPAPEFSSREESAMAEWLSEMVRRGMGISPAKFLDFLQFVIRDEKKETSFTNDRPGYTWYYAFLARNAHIFDKSKESPLKHSTTKAFSEQLDPWFEKYNHFVSTLGERVQQSPTKLLTAKQKVKAVSRKRRSSAQTKAVKVALKYKRGYRKSDHKVHRKNQALSEKEKKAKRKPRKKQLPAQTKALKVTFKWKKGFTKSPEKLQRITAALSDIEAGSSIRSAAKKHSLTESLLRRRINGQVQNDARSGPAPVFSSTEETAMAEWLSEMAQRGMRVAPAKFLDFLQFVIRDEKKKTVFTNDKPGFTWYYSFMARNAHILEKSKETPLEHDTTKASPEWLDPWFEKYNHFVSTQGDRVKRSATKLLAAKQKVKVVSRKTRSLAQTKAVKVALKYKRGYRKSQDKVHRKNQALIEKEKKAKRKPRKKQLPAQTKALKVTFKWKKGFTKSPEKLQRITAALSDIEAGSSIRSAAKKHSLTESLLRRRINGQVQNDARSGRAPEFSSREETAMAEWLSEMAMRVAPAKFLDFLQRIIQNERRKTDFVNDRPGYTWYYSFLARNAHILENCKESPPKVSKSKACKQRLDEWFEKFYQYLLTQSLSTRQSVLKQLECARRFVLTEPTSNKTHMKPAAQISTVGVGKKRKSSVSIEPVLEKSETVEIVSENDCSSSKKPKLSTKEALLDDSVTEICSVCKQTEEMDEVESQWIQCDLCNFWTHIACIPAGHEYDKNCITTENVDFFCHICVTKSRSIN